ncbi:amino acid adenylation domain-containing protein [Nocardia sp. NPDC020380]|uniref:amino acid adenylation domain-containing protein n=1 Tax=Nocardia sp. NPDC020380 TaxID=3364309 RepID=UPI0037BB4F9A
MSTDLLDGLLAQIDRVPDRLAIVVGQRSLTYRELDTATTTLARRLVASGVRPGQTVVVYQQQNLDTVIGMIAALRAAAAWCVIEPGHGGESSLGAVLAALDCAAVLIDGRDPLTPGHAAAALADVTNGPVVIDVAVQVDLPRISLPGPPPSHAPAYAITTSGSTGVPKAVVVSRANLATQIASRNNAHYDGTLVTFSALRLIWDGALLGVVWPLAVGGTGVFPDARMMRDIDAVAELARSREVSHFIATPSFYRLALPRLAELSPSLRTVILMGEAVAPHLVDEHHEVLPAVALHNEYGPTEATITCIGPYVTDVARQVIPMGKPAAGTTAHLLDERLHPVRRGTRGELYLGGGQIADGYAARPGLTATRFVADPFASEPGARMYRTGDLALTDANGDIEFHGRADHQVKVRGVRIERGAVEAVLEDHPAVREAVVLPVIDTDETVYLAAFWVPLHTAAATPAPSALAGFCAERLVPEAVPARFVSVDALPITPGSSKLDEAALRALLTDSAVRQAVSREGWTETERALGEIWSEVLLHDEFDRVDRFLDVGGNSHRVVALHMRLEARWPGAIAVGLLFDLDTVAAQAAALAAAAGDREAAPPAASADIPLAFEV